MNNYLSGLTLYSPVLSVTLNIRSYPVTQIGLFAFSLTLECVSDISVVYLRACLCHPPFSLSAADIYQPDVTLENPADEQTDQLLPMNVCVYLD